MLRYHKVAYARLSYGAPSRIHELITNTVILAGIFSGYVPLFRFTLRCLPLRPTLPGSLGDKPKFVFSPDVILCG